MALTKMEYLQHQLLITQTRAMKSHAELVSGAFRQRKIFQGTQGPELSDDAKAEHVLGTMSSHLRFMQEILDKMEAI